MGANGSAAMIINASYKTNKTMLVASAAVQGTGELITVSDASPDSFGCLLPSLCPQTEISHPCHPHQVSDFDKTPSGRLEIASLLPDTHLRGIPHLSLNSAWVVFLQAEISPPP